MHDHPQLLHPYPHYQEPFSFHQTNRYIILPCYSTPLCILAYRNPVGPSEHQMITLMILEVVEQIDSHPSPATAHKKTPALIRDTSLHHSIPSPVAEAAANYSSHPAIPTSSVPNYPTSLPAYLSVPFLAVGTKTEPEPLHSHLDQQTQPHPRLCNSSFPFLGLAVGEPERNSAGERDLVQR